MKALGLKEHSALVTRGMCLCCFTVGEIAAAVGKTKVEVGMDLKEGKFGRDDLKSLARYVMEKEVVEYREANDWIRVAYEKLKKKEGRVVGDDLGEDMREVVKALGLKEEVVE